MKGVNLKAMLCIYKVYFQLFIHLNISIYYYYHFFKNCVINDCVFSSTLFLKTRFSNSLKLKITKIIGIL